MRPALQVAPDLLGCEFTHAGVTIRLTEVEAYEGSRGDPGSHAYRGKTARNAVMFGSPGHLYVYFTYGMHYCANVVCDAVDVASAVLLRAGEVVRGHDLAQARRNHVRERDLARGPARLAVAASLAREENGLDICGKDAAGWFSPPARSVGTARIRSGPRVGVSGPGGDGAVYPWRFWIDDEPSVSAYRPGTVRRRRAG